MSTKGLAVAVKVKARMSGETRRSVKVCNLLVGLLTMLFEHWELMPLHNKGMKERKVEVSFVLAIFFKVF